MALAATAATSIMGLAVARADGAFPDAQSVLLPHDRPRQIILAATFGLVFSDDDGASWSYACENPGVTQMGSQYSMGPAPGDRIYAVSNNGAPVSADTGCTWRLGGGALANTVATDVFPDPVQADRVFAVAISTSTGAGALGTGGEAGPGGASLGGVFRSLDGGLTYTGPVFTTPAGGTITGVEVAASDPNTVYVTIDQRLGGLDPMLARSVDGGATWTSRSLGAALGAVTPRLVAVDPADAQRLLLRLIAPASATTPAREVLASTTDGGDTWVSPITLPGGAIVGLGRLASGDIVVAATTGDAGNPATLFRSRDGGATFNAIPLSGFIPRGLAARGTVLFMATSGTVNGVFDGSALASSDDEGQTWKPRLKFGDISGMRACVQKACLADCEYLAGITLFPKATCSPRVTSSGCTVGNASPELGGVAVLVGLAGGAWVSMRRRRRAADALEPPSRSVRG